MSEQKEEKKINDKEIENISEEIKEKIDLEKVNKLLHEENQELKKLLDRLKDEQEKLILATKVNTLKEQEIRNDDFKKYANQKVISETLVPMLLEFETALNFKTDNKEVESFLIGFKYIFNNFKTRLKQEGLEEIKLSVGSEFDSTKANATEKIIILEETKDKKNNMICEVLLSGYKLHGRVVSPVQVKIYQLDAQSNDKNKKN